MLLSKTYERGFTCESVTSNVKVMEISILTVGHIGFSNVATPVKITEKKKITDLESLRSETPGMCFYF